MDADVSFYINLVCDAAGCTAHELVAAETEDEVELLALELGWVAVADDIAYCPKHSWLALTAGREEPEYEVEPYLCLVGPLGRRLLRPQAEGLVRLPHPHPGAEAGAQGARAEAQVWLV